MTVKFKVLISPQHGTLITYGVLRSSIIFTNKELEHFEKFGYVLRRYEPVHTKMFWFFSNIEVRGSLKKFQENVNYETVKDIVYKHKEQILTDINLFHDFGDFYY